MKPPVSTDDPHWSEIGSNIERELTSQLTLAFLGSASAGKDAAIQALFGVDFGEISPIPGSTDRLRVSALDAEGRFLIVNAPGFGDIRDEVDEVARKVLDRLDLVIYVLNSEGGATIDERRDLDEIRSRAGGTCPTLVVLNKIDLIREHQRAGFIDATLEQLGVAPEDAVACAFDPHPALASEPINIQGIIDWIEEKLAKVGKELLFAKHLRDRRAACQPLIRAAAKKAAVAGAVPIPGADITALTWIQVKLVEEIVAVHNQEMDQEMVLWLVGELLAGSTKGFIRWAIQGLKTAGWIPGAQVAEFAAATLGSAVAAGTTYGVGEAAIRYVQSDQKLSIDDLKSVFDTIAMQKTKEVGALEGPSE